jgi:hypothetical protein
MNQKTLIGKVTATANSIAAAVEKALGLSIQGQALVVAGFIAGYFGLQAVFTYLIWGFVILTVFRFGREIAKKDDDGSPGAEMTGVEVPPHQE